MTLYYHGSNIVVWLVDDLTTRIEDKEMNQKKDEMLKLMKSQTFGVEIETSGASERVLANYIKEYFNSLGIDCEVEQDSYSHDSSSFDSYFVRDAQGRKWRTMYDGSIRSHTTSIGTSGCAEFVTPVLKYDDIEMLQGLVRYFRSKEVKSSAMYGDGVHIHVGADYGKENGHSIQSLINLVNLMANHQKLLRSAVNFTSHRSQYCNLMCDEFIRRINRRGFNKTWDSFEHAWYEGYGSYVPTGANHYNNSRYQMLNLHCMFNKTRIGKSEQATTEFRFFEFHKNMHAGELKAYIQLVLAMSAYAKKVNYVKRDEIESYNNPKNSMKNWLCNMGLSGDEFKTCRKMLMKRLKGDSGRRTPRPHRDVDSVDDD